MRDLAFWGFLWSGSFSKGTILLRTFHLPNVTFGDVRSALHLMLIRSAMNFRGVPIVTI